MFNAYKRFFAFAGKQKKTWYKGMGYELLRSIFEAIQFIALLVVLRALVEQNVTGETALAALGVMLVSVTGAAAFWYPYEYGDNKTEQAAKRYWDEIKK